MNRPVAALPALAAGLVLADSSIVTLALPEILRELDASVAGVAWVLIAFNLALGVVAIPGARLARARPAAGYGWSLGLFALACLACAAAPSLGLLIAARVGQGVAGAVAVGAALELLRRSDRERAVGRWGTAGIVGAAVGPAAGGVLTEAFSWQAMFALQAPVAVLALAGGLLTVRAGAPATPPAGVRAEGAAAAQPRPPLAPLAALTIVSAASAAALFLLVLMLIEGWRHSPAEAALTVTVLPAAAIAAPRLARGLGAGVRAAAGAILLAGGLAALGLLPGAGPAWTVAPQVLAGAGLGLTVSALTRAALPEGRGPERPASWTIAARHAGVVAGLLLLTPIFTADLERQRVRTERAALADLLDARLPLRTKFELALALDARVRAAEGRLPEVGPAFTLLDPAPAHRPALGRLREQIEEELDRAGTAAFARSFLVSAGIAALALGPLALAAAGGRRRGR